MAAADLLELRHLGSAALIGVGAAGAELNPQKTVKVITDSNAFLKLSITNSPFLS